MGGGAARTAAGAGPRELEKPGPGEPCPGGLREGVRLKGCGSGPSPATGPSRTLQSDIKSRAAGPSSGAARAAGASRRAEARGRELEGRAAHLLELLLLCIRK